MKEGKIGAVIVNYNGAAYQNKALKTIYDSTYKNIEVIIVDSDSKDNSIDLAQKAYPQAYYLLQNENVGVAKGNNMGIRYAIEELDAEYILMNQHTACRRISYDTFFIILSLILFEVSYMTRFSLVPIHFPSGKPDHVIRLKIVNFRNRNGIFISLFY